MIAFIVLSCNEEWACRMVLTNHWKLNFMILFLLYPPKQKKSYHFVKIFLNPEVFLSQRI